MESDVIYLIDVNNKNKRLPIKFNPKISSFKTTVLEQKMETIGGKYPIFFRNGNVNYKEIGISGLISYHMTEPGEFIPESVLFPGSSENEIRDITPAANSDTRVYRSTNLTDDNIRAEKIFRDAVLDWLNDGIPKIFQSSTEGKYLVRLMNVSLTPNETLGRMLYTFNCTAYECGSLPAGGVL